MEVVRGALVGQLGECPLAGVLARPTGPVAAGTQRVRCQIGDTVVVSRAECFERIRSPCVQLDPAGRGKILISIASRIRTRARTGTRRCSRRR